MQIEKINTYNLIVKKTLNSFQTKTDRERDLIDSALHNLKKGNVVIYVLVENITMFGFVSVSVNKLISKDFALPSIEIDYLFVDKRYRGKFLVKNQKASDFLLGFVEKLAKKLKNDVGIRSIILYPDKQDDNLIKFYSNLGFQKEKIIFWNKQRKREFWMIRKIN